MLNLQEVVDQTIKNGGHTVDVGGRYMVALEDFTIETVRDYFINTLPDLPNVTLGTWVHEGKVYLDASIAYSVLKDAVSIARSNNQIAIFDIVDLKEIKTK